MQLQARAIPWKTVPWADGRSDVSEPTRHAFVSRQASRLRRQVGTGGRSTCPPSPAPSPPTHRVVTRVVDQRPSPLREQAPSRLLASRPLRRPQTSAAQDATRGLRVLRLPLVKPNTPSENSNGLRSEQQRASARKTARPRIRALTYAITRINVPPRNGVDRRTGSSADDPAGDARHG